MPKRLVSSSNPSNIKLTSDDDASQHHQRTLGNSKTPKTFTDGLPLPSLLVFDLDYTLWPFWCDTHVSAPLKAQPSRTAMTDRHGESFTFYDDVPGILLAARERGLPMSLASRSSAPEVARELLRGIAIKDTTTTAEGKDKDKDKRESEKEKAAKAESFFVHAQIYPGSKTTHFQRIHAATRKAGKEVAFADMVFFDDEARNRNVETELGVTFCLVRDGVTVAEVDRGVEEWRRRRGMGRAQGREE